MVTANIFSLFWQFGLQTHGEDYFMTVSGSLFCFSQTLLAGWKIAKYFWSSEGCVNDEYTFFRGKQTAAHEYTYFENAFLYLYEQKYFEMLQTLKQ